MYIVVFFLLLWTLFQLILCERAFPNEYESTRTLKHLQMKCGDKFNPGNYYYHEFVFLLETNGSMASRKNSKEFSDLYHSLLRSNDIQLFNNFPRLIILKECSPKIEDIIKDVDNLRFVIHLDVQDFYQNNYNDVRKHGLFWAGDINMDKDIPKEEVCKYNWDEMDKGGVNVSMMLKKECVKHTAQLTKYVKLVSENVMSVPLLYNLVLNFKSEASKPEQEEPYKNHYKILVCTTNNWDRTPERGYDKRYNIKPKFTNKCDHSDIILDKEVVVILAPNSNVIQETHKPVIFYDEPYTLPETTASYKNLVFSYSWKDTPRAFLEFMRSMSWYRVAVLSDDTIQSYAFEEELRNVLNEMGAFYVVLTVYEKKKRYDFSEALTALKQADARIIIANVNEQNSGELARQIEQYGMRSSQKIAWLTHGWSETKAVQAAKQMGTLYNFSPFLLNSGLNINKYIRVIQSETSDYNDDQFMNSRQIANDIREALRRKYETVYIMKTESNGITKSIAHYTNGRLSQDSNQPIYRKPLDRNEDCSIRSANYYKPCDDMIVIYFMLIIVATSVTVLAITYYFVDL